MRGDIEMTFEKYEKAEMEIIEFEAEDDIIMSSTVDFDEFAFEEDEVL